MGIEGIVFRSGKEAKRWLSLRTLERAGRIRNLRRGKEATFNLQTRNPEGLMVTVARYIADFVYEEPNIGGPAYGWTEVVEDAKPSGFQVKHGKKVPFREEIYSLKKKWFEAQYGKEIRET